LEVGLLGCSGTLLDERAAVLAEIEIVKDQAPTGKVNLLLISDK
jgi:hypothetical protein